MTLVQLRHLLSLAETSSFTRSAKALYLTQPALSRSIRALEAELGAALFDRIGRHSELTPFGRDMVERARQLVFDAQELVAHGRQVRDGVAGKLRVGLGSGPSVMLTAPLLKAVANRQPSPRIEIACGDLAQLLQALRNRQLDALIVEVRSLPSAVDLQVSTLAEMRGAFMCRPGHPLVRRRGSLDFDAVRRFPIASTRLGADIAREMTEAYGPDAHPDECVTLRCSEISSLAEVVRDSDAILFAIRAAAPDLVELPLKPALRTTARFGMVTLAGRSEAPALPLLRELVKTLLHD